MDNVFLVDQHDAAYVAAFLAFPLGLAAEERLQVDSLRIRCYLNLLSVYLLLALLHLHLPYALIALEYP